MEGLFLRTFIVSAAVSPVLLCLFLLRKKLEQRYAPQTRWGLWLAIALVLLAAPWVPKSQAPVVVEAPVYRVSLPAPPARKTGIDLPQTAPVGSQGQVMNPVQDPAVIPVQNGAGQGVTPVQPGAPGSAVSGGQTGSSQSQAAGNRGQGGSLSTTISLTALAAGLWFMGMAAVLLWQGAGYLLLRRRLMKGAREIRGLEDYALELGLPEVDFYQCKGILGPMTLGVFHPVVLLPEDGAAPAALRHELYHIKRRDVAYKTLLLLTYALHWFNPLVWQMARQADRDVEACCDAAVVAGQDRGYRRAYGELLLSSAAGERATPFTTHFGGGKEQMKSRLTQLFKPGKRSRGLVCTLLAVAVLLSSLVACRQASADSLADGVYCSPAANVIWPVGQADAEGEDYGSIRLSLLQYSDTEGPHGKPLGEFTLPLAAEAEVDENWMTVDYTNTPEGRQKRLELFLSWPVRRNSIPAGTDYLVVTVKDGAVTRLAWAMVPWEDTLYLNSEYGFSLQLPESWAGQYRTAANGEDLVTFHQDNGTDPANPTQVLMDLVITTRGGFDELYGDKDLDGIYDGGGPRIIVLGEKAGRLVYLHMDPLQEGKDETYIAMWEAAVLLSADDFAWLEGETVQHLTANTMPTLDYYDQDTSFLVYHTRDTLYFHYGDSWEAFHTDTAAGRVLSAVRVSADGRAVYFEDWLTEGGENLRFYRYDVEGRETASIGERFEGKGESELAAVTFASEEELLYTGFGYDMPLLSNVIKTEDGTLVGLWVDYLMGDTIEYLRLRKLTDSGWEREIPFLTPELIPAPRDYTDSDWGFTLHLPEALEGQYVVSKAANWWGFYEKEAYGSGQGFLMGFWAEDSGIYEQSARAGQVLAVKDGITYAMNFSSPEDAEGITDERVHQKVLDLLSALEREMDESSLELSGVTRFSGYLWPLPYTDYGSNIILRPYEEGGYNAMDIYASDTVTVQCAADGVVVKTQSAGDDVNGIVVDQGNGSFAVYAHLEYAYVTTGDHVTRGMILGYAGEENGRRWLSFGRMEGESWDTARYVDPFGDPAENPITYRTYDFQTVSRDTVTFAGDPEITEAYRKVLEDVTDFWDTERQEWRSVTGLSEDGATITVKQYAVVDLDNDIIPEVVLWLDRDGDGYSMGSIVLRYEKAYISGYPMGYRAMNLETLKTDGTFTWADSASFSGTGRLNFRWGGTVEKINWIDGTGGDYESKYFVDACAATREEWESANRVQEEKENVIWYSTVNTGGLHEEP